MIVLFLHILSVIYLLPGGNLNVSALRHPLHVSTTDINLSTTSGNAEIICTLFADDFESAISKEYGLTADLSNPALHTQMDELVKKYIFNHIRISNNSKPVGLTYLGFEKDRESVNVYLESHKTVFTQKIDINVSILHTIFTDQMNIIHFTVKGNRQSTKLDYPKRQISFILK